MSVFDDIIINARTVAETVGKKTSQFIDVSKLRLSAAELNCELAKKYEALGKNVYNSQKTGESEKPSFFKIVQEIDAMNEELKAIYAQIASAKNITGCKNCGAENPKGAAYCCKCGERIEDTGI